MPKYFTARVGTGFVLMIGLMSCSREKKTIDVYRTPPPYIQTTQGRFAVNDWEALKNKQLELQDALDFSDNAPARVELRTHCRSGGESFFNQFSLTGENTIQVWRVLPKEMLSEDLAQKNFTCSYEINLFNSAGSNHIFVLPPVAVIEHSSPGITMNHDADPPTREPLKVTPATMPDVRLRYANSGPTTLQIYCQNLDLKAQLFEQVLDLAQFQFASSTQEAQMCRAVIFQRDQRLAYGPLFQVVPPHAPLTVQADAAGPTLHLPAPELTQTLFDVMRTKPLQMEIWRIHNTESTARYLRFSKAPLKVSARIYYFPAANQPWMKMSFQLHALQILPLFIKPMAEDAAFLTVALNPGADLTIQARFQNFSPLICPHPVTFQAMTLDEIQTATVDEVTRDGILISKLALQTSALNVEYHYSPEKSPAAESEFHCDWN